MNACSLAIILLRFVAMDALLIGGLKLLPSVVLVLGHNDNGVIAMIFGFVFVTLSASLWVLAPLLAKRMTRECEGEGLFTSLNMQDCYTLIFVGVGLDNLVGRISPALNWLHYLLVSARNGHEHEINFYNAFENIFPVMVSITVIVQSKKWAKKLSSEKTPSVE